MMARKWYRLKGNYTTPNMLIPREIEESEVNLKYWVEVNVPKKTTKKSKSNKKK
jgi:hypothetical protein